METGVKISLTKGGYMSDRGLASFDTDRYAIPRKIRFRVLFLSLLMTTISWQSAKAQGQSYAKTKYPVVMVPGAFAFDNVLGVVDYWFGITDELRQQGAEVYVTSLSASSSNIRRGEELLEDIQQIRALTGARKVNLIAHSQGGPAARYVASLQPDWIESVTCVTCMNEGTEFADNLYAFLNKNKLVKFVVNVTLSTVFSALDIFSSGPKDGSYNSPGRGIQIAEDLVKAAGTESLNEFNKKFPEALSAASCSAQNNGREYRGISGQQTVNNVSYFSWGGTLDTTNRLDPIDSILVPIVKVFSPRSRIWDGLVRSCGHPLGTLVDGFYPINHFDAINQAFGLVESGINIPSLYLMTANRLKNLGH